MGQIIVSRQQDVCQLYFKWATVFQMRGNYLRDSSLSFKNYLQGLQSSFGWICPNTATGAGHRRGEQQHAAGSVPPKRLTGSRDHFPRGNHPPQLSKEPRGEGNLQFLICSSPPPELTDLRNRCHWVSIRNKTVRATRSALGAHAHAWKLTSCLKSFIFQCFSSESRNGRYSYAYGTQHF